MTIPEPGEMEDVVARVSGAGTAIAKWQADCADARTWGGPTMYPAHPIGEREASQLAADLRSLLAHISRQGEEIKGLRAELHTRAWGWLFDNPDTGREHSFNHPMRSGECPDAKNISAATGRMLHRELLIAWEAWAEDRATKLAAESTLSSLKGAVGRACDDLDALDSETKDRAAGAFAIKIGRALSSALSELESQCSAGAESKRREDAPSSAPGSDGGEL